MTDTLPVNELFETIQGEATFAGTPSVFVRLQGCPVGCPWCDTRYTWEIAVPTIDTGEMLLKPRGEASKTIMTVPEIVELTVQCRSHHVVITGGEPCIHDLLPLTSEIIRSRGGMTVQIETSGTFPVLCHPATWVTVSPKIDMPGGFAVRDDAMGRANEIKMPIGKPDDLKLLFALLDRVPLLASVQVWLQPLSLSAKATDLCREAATANGFRVSVQTHALAGWR